MLAPAWLSSAPTTVTTAPRSRAQRRADDTQGAELDRLVAVIKRDGGGRTYAGMPSNWGQDFTVGAVPVFKYLESRDVDEVGYTLRTASLMTDPEYYFDQRNPSDYRLFAIRYLILPTGLQTPRPRSAHAPGRSLLAVDAARQRLHPGRPDRRRQLREPDQRGCPQRPVACAPGSPPTAHTSP